MKRFKVKWIIPKGKFNPRQQGTLFVWAVDAAAAKVDAQFCVARALIVHAAMVMCYRAIPCFQPSPLTGEGLVQKALPVVA